MRVAVIGSRDCGDFCLNAIIRHLPSDCTRIISGGATGIDSFAKQAAEHLGLPFDCIVPQYEKYGKLATLKRNEVIVESADTVLAFWDFHSKGTAHTIAACIKQQVPVRVIGLDECRAEEIVGET